MSAGGRPDAGGKVDEPDGGIGGVLMLSTGPTCPEGLHTTLAQELVVGESLR
jgi:hypothetical protein